MIYRYFSGGGATVRKDALIRRNTVSVVYVKTFFILFYFKASKAAFHVFLLLCDHIILYQNQELRFADDQLHVALMMIFVFDNVDLTLTLASIYIHFITLKKK